MSRGVESCPECGVVLADARQHRSDPHHRLFFAVLDRALENWPEGEKFQPEDSEHLRSYVLIKAGHFINLDLRCENPDALSLEDQLRAIIRTVSEKPPLMHSYQWGVRLFWPKSLSYAAVDRKTFNEVSEKVFEIISVTLGVPIEQMKREAKRQAA